MAAREKQAARKTPRSPGDFSETLRAGDVCIDSGHMLNAAFQRASSWCDLRKDIQLGGEWQ